MNNERGQVIWQVLFLLLALANAWVLFSENRTYGRDLTQAHEFLIEDLESVIPDGGTANWANYAKKKEYVTRVGRLRAPFWKVERHGAYVDLLDELQTMQPQIRPATTSANDVQAGMAMLKGIDTAALAKSMESIQQRQAAHRAQYLPKYKEKITKLKDLYQSLS